MYCYIKPVIFQNHTAMIKVEKYLYNYATTSDLKGVIGTDTSKFARKTGLANLKFRC